MTLKDVMTVKAKHATSAVVQLLVYQGSLPIHRPLPIPVTTSDVVESTKSESFASESESLRKDSSPSQSP